MKSERRKFGKALLFAVLFVAFVSVGCASGTAPEEEWNKTFGGTGYEHAYSVLQTADGGYILAGVTSSYGAGYSDFWLVKTDSSGNGQWNKTFGGTDSEEAHPIQQTADGGYILAGYTWSYSAGYNDFWLVKTDSNGNEQWNKTFGGTDDDWAHSVQQTSDSGYILAGGTDSYGAGWTDVWLVKTNSNGTEQWNMTFGGTGDNFLFGYDSAHSVKQTSDGGYILAGETFPYGTSINYDFWVIKVKGEPIIPIFDTGRGAYPSIMGTHNGTITPSCNISVSKLYTYPCAGTGGHTEYVAFYNATTGEEIANGTWNGYKGDWHNLTLTPSITLYKDEEYNYTIKTGSYPQIIHAESKNVTGGTITCTKFTDANGRVYYDGIPAIRLE